MYVSLQFEMYNIAKPIMVKLSTSYLLALLYKKDGHKCAEACHPAQNETLRFDVSRVLM